MATMAHDVPVVEADRVQHEFADGWIEDVQPGITVLRLFRWHGPPDRRRKVVFEEVHIPTFAYDACVQKSKMSCIRGDCGRRVTPLALEKM